MNRTPSIVSVLAALALILVTLVLSSGLTGCSSEPRLISSAPEIVRNVPVLSLQRTEMPDVLEAVGTVRAAQTKSVSPQEFDEVKARYQAALAHRDITSANQDQAKAALGQAHTSLSYTRIQAPFDGVITEKRADPGTLATPGLPIFTIEGLGHYRLEASLNEGDLRFVRTGEVVAVVVDALETTKLKGRVAQIMPAADPGSRSFLVKIELPADARLRTGQFGRAHFSRGQRSSLLIPQTAVVERGQLQGVYVLDQNKIASLRYVTLGKSAGAAVEVLAGLQEREDLVAKPGDLDLNGKRIEAQQ